MPDHGVDSKAYILFELAGATYAVASENVLHLEMVESITPVPETYPYVDGVFFSRGMVLPAINLRVRFGLERIDYALRTRLIVSRIGERTVGFIVDSAREFLTIPSNTIIPPPEEMSEISGSYLRGVANISGRLILILDIEEVIKPAEAEALPTASGNEAQPDEPGASSNEAGN